MWKLVKYMEKCTCVMSKIAMVLVIVGGLNWGLVGVGMLMGSSWNLVNMLLGSMPTIEAIVYIVVALAAITKIVGCRCAKCKACAVGDSAPAAPAKM